LVEETKILKKEQDSQIEEQDTDENPFSLQFRFYFTHSDAGIIIGKSGTDEDEQVFRLPAHVEVVAGAKKNYPSETEGASKIQSPHHGKEKKE